MPQPKKHTCPAPFVTLAAFLRCQRGVSLMEFGLLLPILLMILVGSIEVSRLVLFHQKIDNATSRVADMVTRTNADTMPCTGVGSTQWMRDTVLTESMRPYNITNQTGLIISAVQARYPNPAQPNNSAVLTQEIIWQWRSGTAVSRFGTRNANVAANTNWPQPFRRSPNAGGMFDRDRIIGVEVFHTFRPIFSITASILPVLQEHVVYKAAYYRARFGNLSALGCAG